MKLIAHRGNVSGPSIHENSVEHITRALELGFDVEVDVRFIDGEWWLGHDIPQYKIPSLEMFDKSKIWWHCKNFDALQMLSNTDYNYFWHQEDDHTLTSKGFIWTYPGKDIGFKNVIVMPETVMSLTEMQTLKCFAVCSDFVGMFKE